MFFHSDGTKLFYTAVGRGPAVVLLHPTPVDHRFWMPVAEIPQAKYRVIVPDLRGHGQSERGRVPSRSKSWLPMQAAPRSSGDGKHCLPDARSADTRCTKSGGRCLSRVQVSPFATPKRRQTRRRDGRSATRRLRRCGSAGRAGVHRIHLETLIGPAARRRWPEKVAAARSDEQAVSGGIDCAVQQGLAARPDSVVTARTMRCALLRDCGRGGHRLNARRHAAAGGADSQRRLWSGISRDSRCGTLRAVRTAGTGGPYPARFFDSVT